MVFVFYFIDFYFVFHYFFSSANFGFNFLFFLWRLKVETQVMYLRTFFFSNKHVLVLYISLYVCTALVASYKFDMLFKTFYFLFNFSLVSWVISKFRLKYKGKWKEKEQKFRKGSIILYWVLVGLKIQWMLSAFTTLTQLPQKLHF